MVYSLLLFLALILGTPPPQGHRVEVADLTPAFKVFEDGKYVPVTEARLAHRAFYIHLDADRLKGNYLEINGKGSVLVNAQLMGRLTNTPSTFSIDSLASLYSSSLSVAVYKEKIAGKVTARIVSFTTVLPTSNDARRREASHFADFSVLASGLLFICFVLLLKTNSRITYDYLNVMKLFSLQEREESLTGTKITASFNLLIYLFSCFLIALILLTIHHHSGHSLSFIGDFSEKSLSATFLLWLSLALTLFLGLFIKLIILYFFSSLFDFKDLLALQFMNFMRALLLGGTIVVTLLISYLIFDVQSESSYLLLFKFLISILLLWLPLVFFKLLNRSSNGMFHLFSYLCPSEIFPVLVLIKVLFL